MIFGRPHTARRAARQGQGLWWSVQTTRGQGAEIGLFRHGLDLPIRGGDVIGLLQSPANNVISPLTSGGNKLAGILNTLAEKEETKKLLETSLGVISSKYREILILYYYDDLSYEEISDVLQIPMSTVGVRIKRGKEALHKILLEKKYHHDIS